MDITELITAATAGLAGLATFLAAAGPKIKAASDAIAPMLGRRRARP